ncbi:MAG TPA: zf-HC2 domain-containing protein [Nocardioidaceae bacterium]|nr:zf-HC2 domain-containing protein [Nocardioidaceae bacterium]
MSHLHHKLSALIDGELAGSARRRALTHLRGCDDCRGELQATVDLKRRLTGLRPSEPSADLFSSLDSMPGSAADDRVSQARRRAPLRRALAGAGTVSIAFVSIAYVVGAPETASVAAVVPPVDEANAEFAASAGGYGLSDPAVDALVGSTGSAASSAVGELAPVAFGIGAATAIATMRRGDDAAAITMLRRAVHAPERVAYRGVRTVLDYTSMGPHESRIAVDHVPAQGTSYHVLDGDGPGDALFIDRLRTPDAKAAAADRVSVLAQTYDVGVVGHDEVLGRPATVIGVGDNGVRVASLWIDDDTGVLLDRDLYDNGTLVRSSRYERLAITNEGFLAHPPPELPDVTESTSLPTRYATVLGDQGWTCPERVGDGLTLTALGRVGGSGDMVEAVYSDGISSASLFEQRGVLDHRALAGYRQLVVGDAAVYVRNGLPSTWVWQSADTVYTMLSDAPPAQVAAAVADLPHEEVPSDGALDRIGLGLQRIGGVFDSAH